MKNDKELYRKQLMLAISIQNSIIENSKHFNSTIKNAFQNQAKHLLDILEDEVNLTQLKSLTTNFLTFWQESIGIDTELFWFDMKLKEIPFERRDELAFTLAKERFRRVDQGMSAHLYWDELKETNSIKERFSESEIRKIEEIIEKDKQTRLRTLKKCLLKKTIPKTQYLKFGECCAYFEHCNLFGKYFDKKEETELHEIWREF